MESSYISFILIAGINVKYHFVPTVTLPKFKERNIHAFLTRSESLTHSVTLDLLSDLQSYLIHFSLIHSIFLDSGLCNVYCLQL